VKQGRVSVDGRTASKASAPVHPDADVQVRADADDPGYVSRGGYKLAGALDVLQPLGLEVAGRRCLDAGSSTGGFTDVLLRRGAREVVAVDVGAGQLVESMRLDPRVRAFEGVSVRGLEPAVVSGRVDLLVADLSFISLTTVLPSLAGLVVPEGDLLVMVKPQFEVGKARLGRGGVVRDPGLRASAVDSVVSAAGELDLWPVAGTVSPLPGPAGNVEFFVWLRSGSPPSGTSWNETDSARLSSDDLPRGSVVRSQ